MATVRKKPAISHQPPWLSGGSFRPIEGAGGSRASQGSCRMNCTGSQPTEAHMLRPMISMEMNPEISDMIPRKPRWNGPIWALANQPISRENTVSLTRKASEAMGGPRSAGPRT
jgi:hypothetical protein